MSDTEKKAAPVVPSLNDTILSLRDAAAARIQVAEGGVFQNLDTKFYEETLPSHLSIETVREVSAHNSDFMTATAMAFGEASAQVLAANPELQQTSIQLRAGRDRIQHALDRDGNLVTSYTVFGSGGSGGNFKKVADYIEDLVQSTLG